MLVQAGALMRSGLPGSCHLYDDVLRRVIVWLQVQAVLIG